MFSMKTARAQWIVLLFVLQVFNLGAASANVEAVIGKVAIQNNPNLAGFLPSEDSGDEILISRDQYVISYNKERRSPNWVAWKLEKNQIGKSGRSNDFMQDADLEKYLSQQPGAPQAVEPTEYKGSCFDRGHQSPSGDHTDSPADNAATFVMSNMIPQTPYLNRVIWEHLESYTRDLVLHQGKKVYIVAGPIYDQDFGAIGPKNDIPVPSKDFKVIVVLDANQSISDIDANTQVISVVMPNTLEDGSSPADHNHLCHFVAPATAASRNDWQQFQVPVDQIESLAGLQIFSAIH